MKLNGHITILFSDEGLTVKIEDVNSGCTIVEAALDQKQTCQAMSRLGCTDCNLEVSEYLEYVGKKLEIDKLEFPLGTTGYSDHKKLPNKRFQNIAQRAGFLIRVIIARVLFSLKEMIGGQELLSDVGYKINIFICIFLFLCYTLNRRN